MKKSILLLGLFFSINTIFSQNDLAKEQFNKATRYLMDSPCEPTGIMWAKAAAKNDPVYRDELNRIISGCDQFKYDRSLVLLSEDSTSFKAQEYLTDLLVKNPNDEELNYLLSKISLNRSGGNHLAASYISKAIESNPDNLEYRWMRFRSTPLHDAPEASLELAKRDLEYIKENGKNTGKVNFYLGVVINNLGDLWFYKPVSRDNTFNDTFDKQEAEEIENKKKALEYYNLAKTYFLASFEIEPRYNEKVSVKSISERIKLLSNQLAQL